MGQPLVATNSAAGTKCSRHTRSARQTYAIRKLANSSYKRRELKKPTNSRYEKQGSTKLRIHCRGWRKRCSDFTEITGSDFGLQECRKKQRGVGENGVQRHPHISANTELNPNTKYVFEKLSPRSFQRCYSYHDPGRPGSEYLPVELEINIKPRVDSVHRIGPHSE